MFSTKEYSSKFVGRAFRLMSVFTLLCFQTATLCPNALAKEKWVTEAGDSIQIILPSVAFLSTFIAGNSEGGLWDKEGTWQSVKAIGFSCATMGVGKLLVDKTRPDATDGDSFPSGHTTAAFAGAGFINQRYGSPWGVPSLLAAGFVGYSRIQGDKHFTDDVLAGASIGLLYNWLLVTPQSPRVAVIPMVTDGRAGVTVSMPLGRNSKSAVKPASFTQPRLRYNFILAPGFIDRNEIQAPSGSGSTFDLANFEKTDNPSTTDSVEIDFMLNDRQEIALFLSPYESRDTGSFSKAIMFAGSVFPADTTILSQWLLYDLRARWLYRLTSDDDWKLKLGASLVYQYSETSMAEPLGGIGAEVNEHLVLPLISSTAEYGFNHKLSAGLGVDWMALSWKPRFF